MVCLYPMFMSMEYRSRARDLRDFQRHYTMKGVLCHELRSLLNKLGDTMLVREM